MTRDRRWLLVGLVLVIMVPVILVLSTRNDENANKSSSAATRAPGTTIQSWVDSDSPRDPRDEDGSGEETTTVAYSVARTTGSQYRLDPEIDGVWATAAASPMTVTLPADGIDHTIQVRGRRGSRVDRTPATATLRICQRQGCGAPVPSPTPTPTVTPDTSPTPAPTERAPTSGELFRDDFTGASGAGPGAKWYGICYPIGSSPLPCNPDGTSTLAHLDGNGHLVMPATPTGGSGIESNFSFPYGLMIARIKLPATAGVWSGWWWNNGDSGYVGEIDAMEAVDPHPTVYYASWHEWNDGVHTNGATYECPSSADLSADWHTYATLVTATTLSYYLDNVLCKTVPTPGPVNLRAGKLMLDTASGGWAGTPGSGEMIVDYVAVARP